MRDYANKFFSGNVCVFKDFFVLRQLKKIYCGMKPTLNLRTNAKLPKSMNWYPKVFQILNCCFVFLFLKSVYRKSVKDCVNLMQVSLWPHVPKAWFTVSSHICLSKFKVCNFTFVTVHILNYGKYSVYVGKQQNFEISWGQCSSTLWRQSNLNESGTLLNWKQAMENGHHLTLWSNITSWWMDLGMGANPSSPGTCQLRKSQI